MSSTMSFGTYKVGDHYSVDGQDYTIEAIDVSFPSPSVVNVRMNLGCSVKSVVMDCHVQPPEETTINLAKDKPALLGTDDKKLKGILG